MHAKCIRMSRLSGDLTKHGGIVNINFKEIEKATSTEQIVKLVDFNTLKSAVKAYLKNKEYHSKRNARISQLLKANPISK